MTAVIRILVVCALALAAWPAAAHAQAKAPPPPASSSPAANSSASAREVPAETLEQIVARVRRRLAEEQQTRQKVRRVEPPAPRVTLVWRPAVIWPDAIAAAAVAHVGAPRLQWPSLETTTLTEPPLPDAQ